MEHAAPSWVTLNREQLEARRLTAARDLEAGISQAEVARKYGVRSSTVNNWAQILRSEGRQGLELRKASGRPSKLSPRQREELVEVLLAGPREQGLDTDAWNGPRVHRVIKKKFRVDYHPLHMPRLLRSLGFRPRKPDREALEKNEAAKQEWLESTWEYCKKN